MKKLAVAQIVLGLLIVLCSFVSITKVRFEEKIKYPDLGGDPPQVMINAVPPNDAVSELITLGLGLVVAGCGIAQRKLRTKLANWHIFLGLSTALSSAIISIAIIDSPRVTGDIFYHTYLIFCLGLVITALGTLQFRWVKGHIT